MSKVDLNNPSEPLVLAHRGGRFWQADNFSHVEESLKEGAHIIDFDVRRRKGKYIVQHDYFHPMQGTLDEALRKIPGQTVYLDIKGFNIDPNHLIRFALGRGIGAIILGSFSKKILKKVKKREGVYTCYNTFGGIKCPIKAAKEVDADWISITSVFVPKKMIKKIVDNGFKYLATPRLFRSKRNEDFSHHIKNVAHGAHMVALYNVEKFSEELQNMTSQLAANEVLPAHAHE